MNCKILNFIDNKKELYDNGYDIVLLDVNSLTIAPYLSLDKYQSTDRINITPFVETLKFYVNLKRVLPKSQFVFVFDGGISNKIKRMYPKYKQNRSAKRTKSVFDGNTNNLYDYNVSLISQLMKYFNEIVVPSNFVCNEADFVIGYFIKNIKKVNPDKKMLVISHDHDYLLSFGENVDVIYKYTAPQKSVNYFIQQFECITDIIDFPYLKNVNELILYKALTGDSGDNIDRPFGFKTVVPIKNYFTDMYLADEEVTYEKIVAYFTKHFKNNDNIVSKFVNEFRRNLFLVNIFNDEVIEDFDKIKLNDKLNDILLPEPKKIEINSIYDFILKYGLYFSEEDIDKLLKYIKLR